MNYFDRTRLVYNSSLTKDQKAVLCYLNFSINRRTEFCYPRLKTIAAHTGLGRTTVAKAVKELKALGIITAKYRHRHASSYRINVEALQKHVPEGRTANSEQDALEFVRRTQEVRTANSGSSYGELQTASSTAKRTPQGDAYGVTGGGPAVEKKRGQQLSNEEPSIAPTPALEEELTPEQKLEAVMDARWLPLLQDVHESGVLKVTLKNPVEVANHLELLLQQMPGVRGYHILEVLNSKAFSGLESLSWGLLVSDKGKALRERLILRVNSLVRDCSDEEADQETRDRRLSRNLKSPNPKDRCQALDGLESRYVYHGNNPARLLQIGVLAVRDPDQTVQDKAAQTLTRLLWLPHHPQLPPKIREGLQRVLTLTVDPDLKHELRTLLGASQ